MTSDHNPDDPAATNPMDAPPRERSRDLDFSEEDVDITEPTGVDLQHGDDLDTGAGLSSTRAAQDLEDEDGAQ